MKVRRGKVVMLCMASPGLAVLAGSAFAFGRPLVEERYRLRPRSGYEDARKVAAETLGETRSLRTIPALIEVCKKEAGATIRLRAVEALGGFTAEKLRQAAAAALKKIGRKRALRQVGTERP